MKISPETHRLIIKSYKYRVFLCAVSIVFRQHISLHALHFLSWKSHITSQINTRVWILLKLLFYFIQQRMRVFLLFAVKGTNPTNPFFECNQVGACPQSEKKKSCESHSKFYCFGWFFAYFFDLEFSYGFCLKTYNSWTTSAWVKYPLFVLESHSRS